MFTNEIVASRGLESFCQTHKAVVLALRQDCMEPQVQEIFINDFEARIASFFEENFGPQVLNEAAERGVANPGNFYVGGELHEAYAEAVAVAVVVGYDILPENLGHEADMWDCIFRFIELKHPKYSSANLVAFWNDLEVDLEAKEDTETRVLYNAVTLELLVDAVEYFYLQTM